MTDKLTDDQIAKGAAHRGIWARAAIAAVLVALLLSGYVIVNDPGSKTTTAAKPATQTGFAPIIDEVRPVPPPSTTGQGGGKHR